MSLCKFNANYLQVFNNMQYVVTQVEQESTWYFVFIHVLIEATPREIDMTPVRVTVSNFTTSTKR